MRILLFFILISIASLNSAEARENFWDTFFNYPHHETFQPHMDHPTMPHNTQWQNGLYVDQYWHPQHWVNGAGSIEAVLDGFYKTGVILDDDDLYRSEDPEDQDMEPCIVVGDAFMRLSNQDKRRVARFLDYAHGVTAPGGAGIYEIYYERTRRFWGFSGDPIAYYSKHGLQMQ